MKTTTEYIPEYMMPYFINGDLEGYTDEEIAEAEAWLESSGVKEVTMPSDEAYEPFYTISPAFGQPCVVVECECVLEW